MKPKLNILPKLVECQDILFPDIPSIVIADINGNKTIFDATAYCEGAGVDLPSYATFYTQCYKVIELICKENSINSSELFYQNKNDHLLIDVSLALVFAQYATPEMALYINNLAVSCFINGMVFSETFVARLASFQLPDATLQEIIASRHEQEEKQ